MRVLQTHPPTSYRASFGKNAGFSVLHTIKELEDYEPRYDPTVFPSTNYTAQTVPSSAVPRSAKRQGGYYTAADYRALYLSGELTPIAVVDALLPLIRRDVSPAGEHSIAFLQSKVDLIRAAAEASTARYKNGTSLGPMDGVPVAVKDEVDIDGYKRTVGTKLDYTNKSGGTSWCVKKWEEAGAIVIGKTTMHELGLGEWLLHAMVLYMAAYEEFPQIHPITIQTLGPPGTLTIQIITQEVLQEALAMQLVPASCPLPLVPMAVVQFVFHQAFAEYTA
ncbi:glutamyl-tRNA(Gln) amidotransferase subunit A [Coccidioides immitis RMSCC 2394]|uniref:Glutamyl-tRNA(Gln) amidotransferase subunit A n=1 Tax=Coccidioides immitis RMSCC 2394 TaxID=404692 RepID=A0A0J6YK30_COCIT|nr:glutamyl-tRNA(Gln) amidotransferase subunit A [Coccidioides immitis RMSCC 2394]